MWAVIHRHVQTTVALLDKGEARSRDLHRPRPSETLPEFDLSANSLLV